MSELPKGCTLPVGVEWAKTENGVALFDGDAWPLLSDSFRCYVAARCAMWWDAEEDRRHALLTEDEESWDSFVYAHNTMMAWKELWRELEGVKA